MQVYASCTVLRAKGLHYAIYWGSTREFRQNFFGSFKGSIRVLQGLRDSGCSVGEETGLGAYEPGSTLCRGILRFRAIWGFLKVGEAGGYLYW